VNRQIVQKILLVLALGAIILAYQYFGLDQYLNLQHLKESRNLLVELYQKNPVMVLGVYFGSYIVVTALSLPGALIISLAGGAVFGTLTGTIVVSFASSIGATAACFFSRYLVGNWVQGKFEDKLQVINKGVEEEGLFYLFTLRLIPLFPFFVINLVMGLTKMPIRSFYWVSQLGMLPGTIVFINAGSQLGQLESLSGILSPSLISSFVLIGVFPLIARKSVNWYRSRRSM